MTVLSSPPSETFFSEGQSAICWHLASEEIERTRAGAQREVAGGIVRPEAIAARGPVVHGDRRGRELGFPTANLLIEDDDPIEDGVWGARVRVKSVWFDAAVSVGRRPTFYGQEGARLLEAYLLDFSGDLYGQQIEVHLLRYLRPQRAFGGISALMRQMHRDVDAVRHG